MVEGPFPEHYEPFKLAGRRTALHPAVADESGSPRVRRRPRRLPARRATFCVRCTTYRLTGNFHFWTKHSLINAILQPEEFVEIGEGAGP